MEKKLFNKKDPLDEALDQLIEYDKDLSERKFDDFEY